jgi:transcriptional antiterminator RfaH
VAARKKFWTAAATRLSQERRAAHHLERQNWNYYLPEILVPRVRGGERPEILFPGYIFIEIDARRDWAPLASTRGISRLFLQGDIIVPMPSAEILALREREEGGYVRLAPRFIEGDEIVIGGEEDCRAGFTGIYQGQLSSGRCRVLLTVMGKATEAVVREKDLDAL